MRQKGFSPKLARHTPLLSPHRGKTATFHDVSPCNMLKRPKQERGCSSAPFPGDGLELRRAIVAACKLQHASRSRLERPVRNCSGRRQRRMGVEVSVMKFLRLGVSAVATGLVVAVGGAYLAPALFAPRQNASVNSADPALIGKGRAVAQASDCVACHTAAGGKEFAGGLAMQTPIGVIYSTNITPDKDTGIGRLRLCRFRTSGPSWRPQGWRAALSGHALRFLFRADG